jgi:hypothetical protein
MDCSTSTTRQPFLQVLRAFVKMFARCIGPAGFASHIHIPYIFRDQGVRKSR